MKDKPTHFRDRDRADLRVIAKILSLSHGKKRPKTEILEYISELFTKKGGSWVLFFEGNPDHVSLLKRIIKYLVKKSKSKKGDRK